MAKPVEKVAEQLMGVFEGTSYRFWDAQKEEVLYKVLEPQKVSPAIASEVKKWVVALEGGAYNQGQAFLKKKVGEVGYFYCCLGVLCELAGIDIQQGDTFPHHYKEDAIHAKDMKNVFHEMSFHTYQTPTFARFLADLNDSGASFADIAKVLRYKYEVT